jgi:hypothetical protein
MISVRIARIMELIDGNDDGKISFSEFEAFNRRYPQLLFPAFQLQQKLRESVRGKRYWHREMQKRQQWSLRVGRNLNIWEILETMQQKDAQTKLDRVIAFNPVEDAQKKRDRVTAFNSAEDKNIQLLEVGKKQIKTIQVQKRGKENSKS